MEPHYHIMREHLNTSEDTSAKLETTRWDGSHGDAKTDDDTMPVEGLRSEFSATPFTAEQLASKVEVNRQPLRTDSEKVKLLTKTREKPQLADVGYFCEEMSIEDFEIDPNLLPPGSKLLITSKGRDTGITQRLVDNKQKGASIGSAHYAPHSLDVVLGIVSMVPLPDSLEGYAISTDVLDENKVVTSDIVQPRACATYDNEFYIVAEDAAFALHPDGQTRPLLNEIIGTGHDISFHGETMVVAASDTDQILFIDRLSGETKHIVSMIDHGYNLSMGPLNDDGRHGFYVFDDQMAIASQLSGGVAKEHIKTMLTVRRDVDKVPTRGQTSHVNSVEFIDDSTLLATVFNRSSVDDEGNIITGRQGEIVSITTSELPGHVGQELLEGLNEDLEWQNAKSRTSYDMPDGVSRCETTYYSRRPGNSIVAKEVIYEDGTLATKIDTVTTVETELGNPHSITIVAPIDNERTLVSVSNTSGGELLYYVFDKIAQQLAPVGSLSFRSLPGKMMEHHWIHHTVTPTVLEDGRMITTVYDGARKGVHVVDMTNRRRMFLPVQDGIPLYQTEVVI